MNFLSCSFKNKKKHPKFQLVDIFRERKKSSSFLRNQLQYIDKFAEELSKTIVSYQKIQILSWSGIPSCNNISIQGIRSKIWKYLLKYMLINDAEQILIKKRQQYQQLIVNYWKPQTFNLDQKKIFHTIDADVKRIGVEYNAICKNKKIQQTLKRILFIWHNRHPASGYVQGMCDISMPFLIVFLGQYLPYDEVNIKFTHQIEELNQQTLQEVQADMYWCISKMIESVTTNYTQGFDGLRIAYSKVEQLLYKIDQELYDHFKKEKIDLFALSFKNISTMLLRIFNPNMGVRLFDTYLSIEGSFPDFMVFILIGIMQKNAKKMLLMKFQDLMVFLQNLPTKEWNCTDIQMIIAEAYCYQQIFNEMH